MATTTATLTLSSSDLTGDSLALSTTATLTKAGVLTGLDQTTGVARKFYASATTNGTLLAAAGYTADKAHKIYIKNTSSTAAEFIKITIGSSNVALLPWDGANDIDIDTSATNMTIEYMVVFEA